MCVDLTQDPHLHVVDGQWEEHLVVDGHQGAVATFTGRGRRGIGSVVRVNERTDPVRDGSLGDDLVHDPAEDLDNALLRAS